MYTIEKQDLNTVVQTNLPWDQFAGKTIVITGANGFIPSFIVKTFLFLETERGIKTTIIGIVRDRKKAAPVFKNYQKKKHLHLLVADIVKPLFLPGKVDYIFHAASHASPTYYGRDPVGTILPNTVGTYNLLELARRKAVRGFLFFSSGEVYGKVPNGNIPTEEDDYGTLDPTDLRSCYAESKRLGETLTMSYFHQYRTPVTIARLFHTYGPGMHLSDGRVQTDFVGNIVANRNIVIHSDGRARRTFCYISDTVLGCLTILLCGMVGKAYNVGNDQTETTICDLARVLVTLFPEKRLKVVYRKQRADNSYLQSSVERVYPQTRKLRALGWRPRYSLSEGFKRTIQSYYVV